MRPFLAMFACLLGTVLGGDAPQMLVGAHSHNDYKHEHPLDDALAPFLSGDEYRDILKRLLDK